MTAMSVDKLKTQLSNAGFSAVKVVDAPYLIQAQTSDGNRVLVLINPPSNLTEERRPLPAARLQIPTRTLSSSKLVNVPHAAATAFAAAKLINQNV